MGGRQLAAPPQRSSALRRAAPQRGAVGVVAVFGKKIKTCVVTGTTSGLGLETAKALVGTGEWKVICANRSVEKMEQIAEEEGWGSDLYDVMELDLASFESTSDFAAKLRKKHPQLDALICNAALYLPNQAEPSYTEDGHETSLQVNHLSHQLLTMLLLDDIKKSRDPRIVIVGSITGNTNTVGGGAVLPFADLGELEGLRDGGKEPTCMIDGKEWDGAKAYKDSKLANMMTVLELDRRFTKSTGVPFTSMYPGCIAESGLFRQKRGWFRFIFPLFMKYVTGGYVSQPEAGERLAQCIADPALKGRSGVYWSWNGGARTVAWIDPKTGKLTGAGGSGGEIFENQPSKEVRDEVKGGLLWDASMAAIEDYLPAKYSAKGGKKAGGGRTISIPNPFAKRNKEAVGAGN